jgi:hypothetical protein
MATVVFLIAASVAILALLVLAIALSSIWPALAIVVGIVCCPAWDSRDVT